MGSLQRQKSPESDAAVTDERKRKRMISNRESARRSRMRKQKQLGDLVNEVTILKNENSKIAEKLEVATKKYVEMESRNDVLRAQALELTETLRSFNSVLEALDIPEIPESMQNPWQLPCSLQPIRASADMFEC